MNYYFVLLNAYILLSSIFIPLRFSLTEQKDLHRFESLLLGFYSIMYGQVIIIIYDILYHKNTINIFNKIVKHFLNIEGFALLGGYLSLLWLNNFFPESYYSSRGYISLYKLTSMLLVQDFMQYWMHRLEHKYSNIYKITHSKHHLYIHPTIYDSFSGSIGDTIFMILIPLTVTTQIIKCNLWTFIAFGTIYSNTLTLIHSREKHNWEDIFRYIGIGTSIDHQIHHKYLKYNYGHVFMYWDYLFDTYKSRHKTPN